MSPPVYPQTTNNNTKKLSYFCEKAFKPPLKLCIIRFDNLRFIIPY
uniref:Uncharacterized protein n=1 Tax=Siphoviridae sp. ct5TL29 TaxID=2825336 RepID=A0A8S5PCN9_9CAUD|nr:MAG TPA: hypothetical protein [Siphoviridae sp. ct5TL29]